MPMPGSPALNLALSLIQCTPQPVRKNTPLLFPSSAMRVSVGEEEAGEICTTPAGAVTLVTTRMARVEPIDPLEGFGSGEALPQLARRREHGLEFPCPREQELSSLVE